MKTEIAIHVFASLQGLEKSFETLKSRVEPKHKDIVAMLPKQEEILVDMRRSANLLQLNIAKKDWFAAVRALKIFYGLNQLIRPDILKAFGVVTADAAREVRQQEAPQIEAKAVIYH